MSELPDFPCDKYDPGTVMARVGHLPVTAQRDIERISRIIRAAFGHGGPDMAEPGRIMSIALTGPLADGQHRTGEVAEYDFLITVNLTQCADEAHWTLARQIIAAEIGNDHPVTFTIEQKRDEPSASTASAILLYDDATDIPLNIRELALRC